MTLLLDISPAAQSFFDGIRTRFFPKHKLKDAAHITLIYQMYDHPQRIIRQLESIQQAKFNVAIGGIQTFPNGNAIRLDAPELLALQLTLKKMFFKKIIKKDLVKYKPHITVQLGVTQFKAQTTASILQEELPAYSFEATGLSLWKKDGKTSELVHRIYFT